MEQTPHLSVILPVYNAGPALRAAVQSVLDQTYRVFELIMIDDGSTDDSWKTMQEYKDPRIHMFTQKNRGLFATLNRGLGMCLGQFIARMDQDDWSHPDRFTEQVRFLDNNPECGLVGSWIDVVDTDGNVKYINRYPITDEMIRLMLSMQNTFAHGSIMMRKSLQASYRSEFDLAEDYDLWCRISTQTKMANIPKVLYRWTYNPAGITLSRSAAQSQVSKRIQAWYNRDAASRQPLSLSRQTIQQELAVRGRSALLIELLRLSRFFLLSGDNQRFFRIGLNAVMALALPGNPKKTNK